MEGQVLRMKADDPVRISMLEKPLGRRAAVQDLFLRVLDVENMLASSVEYTDQE